LIARKPLYIFIAVQRALFLRELGMRFSTSKMGLFWTFIEPFMQVLMFVLIHALVFPTSASNIDMSVFFALNFTAYNMFRNITMKSMGAFRANHALFIYKQVKPIDTIFARISVEIFITGIIISLFLLIGLYFDFDINIKNIPMVTVGFIWLILFSLGMGLILAISDTYYPSVGKIVNIFMMLLMFGSAIFYSIEMMPTEVQNFLLINPLTHFMEIIHGSYFYSLDDQFVDYTYILLWTVSYLFGGLWLYRHLEEKIISL